MPKYSPLVARPIHSDFSLLALHSELPERYPFLLQSSAIGPELGRFDILFAFPGESLVLDGLQSLSGPCSDGTDFFDALDTWRENETCARVESPLPFHGGWFLYLGYELASQVEPRLVLQPDPLLPTAFAVRCPAAFVREHASGSTFIVCEQEYEANVEQMLVDSERTLTRPELAKHSLQLNAVEEPPEYFLDAVVNAKSHVTAGDVYQANLSRAWRAELDDSVTTAEIYARLCNANPAPFAGLVRWQDKAIISSSPERLVEIRDRTISTRPIAGTRPRGADDSADSALSDELFGHPKERAEHVMLIDLERNDLGRVCKAGSVEVSEYMVLESYAHVHHIVSNVRGVLQDDVTPGAAIRAVFPGGTITGCPKVRCMELIAELEHGPRGAYTGSIGYLNHDGSLDLNILIRTMVMGNKQLELRAGSGIVADSDPHAELAETRAKAKGLLMALV